MPSAVVPSRFEPLLKSEDSPDYIWSPSEDGTSWSRHLSHHERMHHIMNVSLHGQGSPKLCMQLSLRNGSSGLTLEELTQRARQAFKQTRYSYPSLGFRVHEETNRIVYKVEGDEGLDAWVQSAVKIIIADGDYLATRETISHECPIPTSDGDYFACYVQVRPADAAKNDITTFNAIISTTHAIMDGHAFRTIFNEFLTRLAQPLAPEEICWGQETNLLYPPAHILEKEQVVNAPEKERFQPYSMAGDVGLPLYRPEINMPTPEMRGTVIINHTFEDPGFLLQLRNRGRSHKVKLTAMLHAALLKTNWEILEDKPTAGSIFKSGSPMDLRNGYMQEEFNVPRKYYTNAVSMRPIELPCELVAKGSYWAGAQHIQAEWNDTAKMKGISRMTNRDAEVFLEYFRTAFRKKGEAAHANAPPPAKPRTCPFFISDPAGSGLLAASYPFLAGAHAGTEMVIDHYQLGSENNQALAAARSHSWNDKLTLTICFNPHRLPRPEMEAFLDKWVSNVAAVEVGAFDQVQIK